MGGTFIPQIVASYTGTDRQIDKAKEERERRMHPYLNYWETEEGIRITHF
jgi:hypothetical protein